MTVKALDDNAWGGALERGKFEMGMGFGSADPLPTSSTRARWTRRSSSRSARRRSPTSTASRARTQAVHCGASRRARIPRSSSGSAASSRRLRRLRAQPAPLRESPLGSVQRGAPHRLSQPIQPLRGLLPGPALGQPSGAARRQAALARRSRSRPFGSVLGCSRRAGSEQEGAPRQPDPGARQRARLRGAARSRGTVLLLAALGKAVPVAASVYAIPLGWRLAPGEYSKLYVNEQGFRRRARRP